MGTVRAALVSTVLLAGAVTGCGGEDPDDGTADAAAACAALDTGRVTGTAANERLVELAAAETEWMEAESNFAIVATAEALLLDDADELDAVADESDADADIAQREADQARWRVTPVGLYVTFGVGNSNGEDWTQEYLERLERIAAAEKVEADDARAIADTDQAAAAEARESADAAALERAAAEERFAAAEAARPSAAESGRLSADVGAAAGGYGTASVAAATAASKNPKWDPLLAALTRLEATLGGFGTDAPWDADRLATIRTDEAAVIAECRKVAAAESDTAST